MSSDIVINDWTQLTKLVKSSKLIEVKCNNDKDNSHNLILFLKTNKLKYFRSLNESHYMDDWYQSEPELTMILLCCQQKTKESRHRLYFLHKNNKVFLNLRDIEDYMFDGIKITVLN